MAEAKRRPAPRRAPARLVEFPPTRNPLALDWSSIEHRALWCPYLHAAVTMVRAGAMTREEALTWAAIALSGSLETMTTDYTYLLRRSMRTVV